jgi:hypothetical protein
MESLHCFWSSYFLYVTPDVSFLQLIPLVNEPLEQELVHLPVSLELLFYPAISSPFLRTAFLGKL